MNFKVFAALFIAVLAIQTSSQSPLKDDSIKEIILNIAGKVLKVAKTALDKANNIVDNVEKNKEKIKKEIVDFAVKEGKQVNVKIIALIDELKDGATDDGKSVVNCITAEQQQTDAAFGKAANKVGDCLGNEVDVVLPKLKSILSELNDLEVDLQGQTDTLAACTSEEITCLISFASTIITTAKKIPPIVKTDIEDVLKLVKTVIVDVKACQILPAVKTDIQTIFNEAVVCIKK